MLFLYVVKQREFKRVKLETSCTAILPTTDELQSIVCDVDDLLFCNHKYF